MRTAFRSRLRVLLFILGAIALGLIIRLVFVQIIYGTAYAKKADQQYAASGESLYNRGTIYFTRKDGTHIAAATLKAGFLLAINPEILTNPDKTYVTLNSIVPISRTMFFSAIEKRNDPYKVIAHRLTKTQGDMIAKKRLTGVTVIKERWRVYPGGTLAAHAIGFTAYNNTNTTSGQYGLERYYNNILKRSGDTYRNFFAQIFSNLGDVFINASATREGDIVTSIEPEVESRLLTDLMTIKKKYNAQSAGGIIMIPKTGAIVALASVPTYNPNTFQTASTSVFTDPLVQYVHEYGSIMKPITMAASLTAGVVTPSTTYDDTGCIRVDGDRICNWDFRARGVIPVGQIIVQSLNVGASWLAVQLGQTQFRKYFLKAFGQKTGIDLPGEIGGLLNNLNSTRQVDFDTMAFGQGIAITPMQMIRASGAIANEGVMMQPHLVTEKILTSGKIVPMVWNKKIRLFSARASEETAQMMTDLTNTQLYDGKYKIPGIPVAVKTGTAQLTKPGGGYYTNQFFHSYIAFFPSNAPRFIILLYLNHPDDIKHPYAAEYSSETLTKPTFDLVNFLINYYQIPPNNKAITSATL